MREPGIERRLPAACARRIDYVGPEAALSKQHKAPANFGVDGV
jgi:hypothetical protein